eukprot:703499_1
MKLFQLFGILLPLIHAAELTYLADGSGDIASFSFTWKNPDRSNAEKTGPDDGSVVTDGDTGTGEYLTNPDEGRYMWGSDSGTTQGMTGSFIANTLNVATDQQWFHVTAASIAFRATQSSCIGSVSTALFYYTDAQTGTRVHLGDATVSVADKYLTFTANIPTGGINTQGGIGFDVATNLFCAEAEIQIVEFSLEGESVATETTASPTAKPSPAPTPKPTPSPTPKPSTAPTPSPSPSPTTKPSPVPTPKPSPTPTPKPSPTPTPKPSPSPTMAPTKQCKGQVTWGEPHFLPMAVNNQDVNKFDYQGAGWHYYFFPCDWERDYDGWPFFLLAEHVYDRRSGRGTILGNHMIILNTKPDPWIIEFQYDTQRNAQYPTHFDVTVGTDVVRRADFAITAKQLKQYTRKDPLVIEYNDGATNPQTGEMRVFVEKQDLFIDLYNVRYDAFPRVCSGQQFGTQCGDFICPDQVISIANRASETVISCPTCFRNIACGLMGRYTRGDCTKADLHRPASDCYNILRGSDGTLYTPPTSNRQFVPFAETWHKNVVDDLLENAGFNVLHSLQKSHHSDGRSLPSLVGRAVNTSLNAFLGACNTDAALVALRNETCRQNTIVKYADCCKEIGICHNLWKGCTYDLCACADPVDGILTVDECLDIIVFESMNMTCGFDRLYPTDAPTTAPTDAPTVHVQPKEFIPQVQKLIWFYLAVVLVFAATAIGAFCYYKKKNVAKISVPDDEEVYETAHDKNAVAIELFTR